MDHNTIFALQSTPSIVNINKFSQYNSRLMKTGYKRIRPMCNEMNLKKMNRIDNDDNDDSMEDQRINIPNNNIQQQHHEEQDVITHQSVLHRSLAECLKRLCNEIQSNHFLPITMNTSLNTDTINSMNNDYSTCITTPITIPTTNINTTNTSVSMYPTQALDLSITSNITLNECITNDSLNITNTFNKSLSPSPTLSSYYSLNNNNNNLIALTLSSSSSDSSTSLMSSFSNNTMPQQEQQQQQQRNTVSLTNITSHTDSLITSLNYDTSNNIHTNVSSSNDDHSQQQTIHYDSPNIINNAQTLLFPGLTPTIFNLPPCLTCTNTLTPIKSVTDQLINEKGEQDEIKEELFTKITKSIYLHQNELSNNTTNNNTTNNSNINNNPPAIINNILNPTELILNYATNYYLHGNHQSFNNKCLTEEDIIEGEEGEDMKKDEISTCTSPDETILKEFDNELSSKRIDSSDMEQLDLKTTSLWFTESDIHSIPNLVESIKKYHSNDECGFDVCRSSKLREHYHCSICNKIILRREEMIRHAKWHRKREESMQYGFMRYSPCDDCTVISCPHNGRQTHYHCMQSNCDKVYVSTSDVQMHANYHRKDAVIIQEGFQRFRATENCGITKCPFYKECTTHFHCRRNNCHFTFKNKADMEKHKVHHQKNDRFAQDGFRRYIKCENCDFPDCQYSGVINHIHCIRPGCDYVIHSSSQLMSHKRKHDRRFASFSPKYINMLYHDDINQTFSPSNQNNNNNNNNNDNEDLININENKINKIDFNIDIHTIDLLETNTSMSHLKQSFYNEFQLLQNDFNNNFNNLMTTNNLLNKLSKFVAMCIYRRENWEHILLKINNFDDHLNYEHLLLYKKIDKILISIYQSYNQYLNKCFWPGCHSNINSNMIDTTTTTSSTTTTTTTITTTTTTTNNNDNNGSNGNNNDDNDVKQYRDSSKTWCKYWLSHLWEACLSFYAYTECNQSNCPIQSNNNDNNNNDHIHCRFWPKCNFINLSNQLNFQILYKHFLSHNEYLMTNSLNDNQNQNQYHVTMDTTYNNLMNPKRRGRPPKYAKHIYVPHINPPEYLCIDNQYTIDLTYSMFFDPIDNNIDQNVLHNHVSNYNTMLLRNNNNNNNNEKEQNQFKHIKYAIKLFLPNEICPDMNCPYYITHEQHYHCVKPRCYMSTNKLDLINIHRREFHQHTIIEKGFEYYDISIDCRRPLCHNNKINKHFHCIYPNCDYTFIRSSTMQQHLKKHTENLKTKQNIINKTQHINQSIVAMATNTSSSIDINIMNNNNNTKCNHSNNIQSMNSLHPIDIHSEQLLSIPLCNHQMNNANNDDNNNNMTKKDCTEDSSLPNLQPNWTAAMVTNVNDVTMGTMSSPVKIDCSSECTNECL
ncbi:hypothetical protein MS3_00009153 [Schistosoma haematobium]|uniref:C2H2-type domain-containing protein n=1 Tax=Schistosoma haematobium TaxID=6185 RepID=A0A922LEA9_SCHHA|nr:hypothetical protein MS3_00009153 [Schistosoma haematobium]KAH9580529.1 hypothetical protein MS3_00009153 [Schistosoma haematobium]